MHSAGARRRATPAQIAAWVALLVTVVWLSLRGWGSFQVGIYQDDAVYTVLARSLVSGGVYGLVDHPGPPPEQVPKHPFVFPLVLAPVVWLLPHDLLAPTFVTLAATLLNLALLFWGWPLLSPTTSRWWGLGVAWLHGCAPLIVGHTRIVFSEPVFTTFVLLALLLTEACARARRGAFRLSVPLGATLMLAVFTRSIGVVLVLAVLLRLLVAARRVGPAPLLGVFLGGVGSLLLVLALTPVELRHLVPAQYVVELRDHQPVAASMSRAASSSPAASSFSAGVLVTTAEYALRDVRRLLIPVGGGEREIDFANRLGMPALPPFFGACVTLLVCFGAWCALRTQALAPSLLLFEILYLGCLLVWPWATPRFLYPVQPLLVFELWLAIVTVGAALLAALRRRRPRTLKGSERSVAVVIWAVLLVLALSKSLVVADSRSLTRDLTVGSVWLRENSPPDAIVMARHSHSVHLYAERKMVELVTDSAAELDRVLDARQVDYILIGPGLYWDSTGALTDEPADLALLPGLEEMTARGRLNLVYESPPRDKVRIYRVNRPAPGATKP